ncbi:MAG TPA: polyprenol monophosphomannose synthase [Methylomirabilota bacterium]|nr:polyprenol monophosphomannose synthase [Methylomirabilota bacterium]
MKIVVVTATYNEKDNIGKLITLVEEEVFPKIKHHDMWLLVADDNSPDGTADVVRDFMQKYNNLDINSGPKKGLGAAYIRAMSYAIEHMGADIIMSIDGDLQHDPHTIPEFLKKIEQGYDVVCATRYSDGGSMPKNWPLHRKAFSVIGNLIVRTVTGRFHLHDWTSGFRAIKKEVFLKEREKVRPFQGYTFMVAFLYKSILDGYKAGEVPIHLKDRISGNSKIAPLEYIISLLKYVISERIHECFSNRL